MIKIISTLLDDTRKVIIQWFETDKSVFLGTSFLMSGDIFREEKPYPDSHHIEGD